MEFSLLVSAKKIGMSFEEVNMLTVADLLEMFNTYIGASATDHKGRRKATQEDIDKMFK